MGWTRKLQTDRGTTLGCLSRRRTTTAPAAPPSKPTQTTLQSLANPGRCFSGARVSQGWIRTSLARPQTHRRQRHCCPQSDALGAASPHLDNGTHVKSDTRALLNIDRAHPQAVELFVRQCYLRKAPCLNNAHFAVILVTVTTDVGGQGRQSSNSLCCRHRDSTPQKLRARTSCRSEHHAACRRPTFTSHLRDEAKHAC